MTKKVLLSTLCMLLIFLLMAACVYGGEGSFDQAGTVSGSVIEGPALEELSPVTGLALETAVLTPYTGTTVQANILVSPYLGKNKALIWSSDNESVATVSQDGTITAIRNGTAVIKAEVAGEEELYATCVVYPLFYDVPEGSYYFAPVCWAVRNYLTYGYDGVYFAPQQACSRRELMIFLWRMVGCPGGYGDARAMFNDMWRYDTSTESNQAVAWGYANGLIRGYSDGGFHPDATIARKDVMIILYRFAYRPAVSGTISFPDVLALGYGTQTDTYRSILWGTQMGITKGYGDGGFYPLSNCLREHIITFLYRFALLIGYPDAGYPHVHSISSEITTPAACTTTGTVTHTCSGCGYAYTGSIPATGHKWTDINGKMKCAICGATDELHETADDQD